MKEVVVLTGAGQIGMAIARRISYGKKLIIGDKNVENAEIISKIMIEAGFDVEYLECDISSRTSIKTSGISISFIFLSLNLPNDFIRAILSSTLNSSSL